jgi:hypothetical protein
MLKTLCAVLPAAAPLAAQQPTPAAAAQQQAISKLAYMAGVWEGEGWMDLGGGRRGAFRGTETIQARLNGAVLLLEGHFVARIPGAPAEVPVHSTVGVISYQPQERKYRLTSWLATGTSGDAELMLDANGWHWQIATPAGPVRYTMTLGASGQWVEIGERSSDGRTWEKVFEMTLRKR